MNPSSLRLLALTGLVGLTACSPQVPEISYLQVGPTPVYAHDNVNIQLAVEHPELEVLESLTVELYINEVRQDPPLEFPHVPVGEPLNLRIPKSRLKKDRLLIVKAQASDGTNVSRIETSEPVYVFNTPPDDGDIKLLPLEPRAQMDPLVCTSLYGFADPDEKDNLTWQVDWYLNNSLWVDATSKTTYRGDTIDAKYLRAGQVWQCGVTLSDGQEYTISTSAKVTVLPNPYIIPPDNGDLYPDTGTPDVPTDTGIPSDSGDTAVTDTSDTGSDSGIIGGPTDTSVVPTDTAGPSDTSSLPELPEGDTFAPEPTSTDVPEDTGIAP